MSSDQHFLPGDEPRDDVEAHGRVRATDDVPTEDDVEAHMIRPRGLAAEEPDEDDVEGHVNPKGL